MKNIPELDVDYYDDPVLEKEPVPHDMCCPKIKPKHKKEIEPNWTVSQCILRIELQSSCTRRCLIATELKKTLARF
jgi:hypothetical protein